MCVRECEIKGRSGIESTYRSVTSLRVNECTFQGVIIIDVIKPDQ